MVHEAKVTVERSGSGMNPVPSEAMVRPFDRVTVLGRVDCSPYLAAKIGALDQTVGRCYGAALHGDLSPVDPRRHRARAHRLWLGLQLRHVLERVLRFLQHLHPQRRHFSLRHRRPDLRELPHLRSGRLWLRGGRTRLPELLLSEQQRLWHCRRDLRIV